MQQLTSNVQLMMLKVLSNALETDIFQKFIISNTEEECNF